MSSVEQRVDQHQGKDPTLENHDISAPAPDLEVSLNLDRDHKVERGTEKVIEQERRRAAVEQEPNHAPSEPPVAAYTPPKPFVPTHIENQATETVQQTPKEEAPVDIILKKMEPKAPSEEEPRRNKMFPPRPVAREPEPEKIVRETTIEPIKAREEPRVFVPPTIEPRPEPRPQKETTPIEKTEKQESPQIVMQQAQPVREEPLTQRPAPAKEVSLRLEEQVEKIVMQPQREPERAVPVATPTEPALPVEPTQRTITEPRIEAREQEIRIRTEQPPTLEPTPAPEQAPRLTLEEKIELIRAELKIQPTVIEEPVISAEPTPSPTPVTTEEPIATEEEIEERPIQKIAVRQQPEARVVLPQNRPLPEAELQMEHRRTPTLEQAMKFEFARAKINTGKKATIPGFRGHGFGSGTMLDKLITYLADLIKKLEIRFFSMLNRRRLERRVKPVKVVPTEEEGFHLESFPRSLSHERKKKGRFFSRFSRFSK